MQLTQRRCAVFVTTAAMVSTQAVAHVKWFCGPIDTTTPPLGLAAVLSPVFLSRAVVFITLIALGALADSVIVRRWPRPIWQSLRLERTREIVIRLGVGAYAVGLWDKSAVVPWGAAAASAILTPELLDRDRWISPLQLAVGLLLTFRSTCPLAALGLVILYGLGVARYGVFHMTDYVYFLGLAGYLGLTGKLTDRLADLRRWRVPLLVGSLGFSLMWTAIEKFLYPVWTQIVLVSHPSITMGLPIPFVTVMAGFVEFSLAFYLLVGHSLLRLDAFIFMLIFIGAIPEFGELDRVGHLPIIAILLVVIISGPTRLQAATRQGGAGPLTSAVTIAGLYGLTLAVMMGLYYGLQRTDAWG